MSDLYKRDEFGLNVTGAQPTPSNPAQDYSDSLNVLSKTILKQSVYGNNSEMNWKGGDTGTLAQGKPYRDPQTSSYMARANDRAQINGRDSADANRVNRYVDRMNRRDRNGAEGGANIPTSGNPNNIPVNGGNFNFGGLNEWKSRQPDSAFQSKNGAAPLLSKEGTKNDNGSISNRYTSAPLGQPLVAASTPTPSANPDDWKDYQPVGQFAVRSGNTIFSRFGNASTTQKPSQNVADSNFVDDLFGRKKSL